ncbi:hypothetical protein [Dyadobacter sp. CY326]|uniref:hypothetical protein n=1 Tax=Dyadobacter sp. CY326 TaxID=2907300 RepID=UPI001F38B1E3|nr:hypothetical protein [Dyadobacter sp. CY326]MCE7065806.1 hypothetical protein [Dyadobacter sp. CY326]
MAYHIHGVIASTTEFNDQRLGLYTLGELGNEAGLKVETSIGDYKKGILHILSKLTLLIEQDEQSHWLSSCKYVTIFELDEPSRLLRGPSKNALNLLKECCDLSQAHAFGQFYYALTKNNLPLVPSQIQPFEGFQKAFYAFLEKNNELKKKR